MATSHRRSHAIAAQLEKVRSRPAMLWVVLAIRIVLIGLLIYAATNQDQPQFHGKAMTWRLVLYPAVTLIVPAIWWFWLRRVQHSGFPYGLDLLVALPAIIDIGGNTFNLYDRLWWWDDFNHFLNPVFISIALGLILLRLPLGRLTVIALLIGAGTVIGLIWEFAEYVTFVRRSPEFNSAYEDTIGDLALDLAGSIAGALVIGLIVWPRVQHHLPAGARMRARALARRRRTKMQTPLL